MGEWRLSGQYVESPKPFSGSNNMRKVVMQFFIKGNLQPLPIVMLQVEADKIMGTQKTPGYQGVYSGVSDDGCPWCVAADQVAALFYKDLEKVNAEIAEQRRAQGNQGGWQK
jgi:hypothetical protein